MRNDGGEEVHRRDRGFLFFGRDLYVIGYIPSPLRIWYDIDGGVCCYIKHTTFSKHMPNAICSHDRIIREMLLLFVTTKLSNYVGLSYLLASSE